MIPTLVASRTGRARAPAVGGVAAVVAMLVLGGPAALAGLVPGPGMLAGSCASASEVHAGLVVDFGTVDMGTARPANTSDCVADPGANGVTLLAKRFGKSGVRIGSNGLICAIDGYPTDGCGDHLSNGKYRYWSYWKGGSEWQYSPVGPAGRVVKDGTVDGWHFVEGSASPSDGAPGNSGPAGPCGPTTPTSPTVTTSPSSGGGSGGSGGAGGSGGSGGSSGQATPTSGDAATTDSTAAPGAAPVDGTDPGSGAAADPATGETGAAGGSGGTGDVSGAENAAEVASSGGSGGGGLPLAAIGVAVAVVALGAGAVTRFRGRTDE